MTRLYHGLHRFLVLLLIVLSFSSTFSFAQVGIEASYVSPNGDIGQFFKKNMSIDVFAMSGAADGRLRARLGFFYTKLSPRMDTVPIYAVQYPGTVIVPGFLVNGKLTMEYIYGDLRYRFVRIKKKLSLFAGLGFEGGMIHESHVKVLETIITDHTDEDVWVGGYKACISIEYKISPRFDVFCQENYIHLTTTDHSSNLTHATLGAGMNYYFVTSKRKQKKKPKHTVITND